jgi:hypothetical protein
VARELGEGAALMRRTIRSGFIVALISISGCLQPTDVAGSAVSLAGRWQYSAVQNDAAGATLRGTLVIAQQSGASFQGSLDVTSTSNATGEVRSIAGTVSGAALTGGAIDFDAFLETAPRRHVAKLVGDTLSGTWLRLSDQGVSASGTFTARRIR